MYEDSGARDVNCLLSQVQMFKIYILWPKVWWLCFCGYINSQVCPLDMFVFTELGLRNYYMYIYGYFVCGMV